MILFLRLFFLKVTMALLGKFGATGSFAIVFVYTAELFPTEIRLYIHLSINLSIYLTIWLYIYI